MTTKSIKITTLDQFYCSIQFNFINYGNQHHQNLNFGDFVFFLPFSLSVRRVWKKNKTLGYLRVQKFFPFIDSTSSINSNCSPFQLTCSQHSPSISLGVRFFFCPKKLGKKILNSKMDLLVELPIMHDAQSTRVAEPLVLACLRKRGVKVVR